MQRNVPTHTILDPSFMGIPKRGQVFLLWYNKTQTQFYIMYDLVITVTTKKLAALSNLTTLIYN